jgi:hypothetical protein
VDEAVDEGPDPERRAERAGEVEAASARGRLPEQPERPGDDGDADRDVDEEDPAPGGEPSRHRRQGEQGDPGDEGAAAAEEVAGTGAEEEQAPEGEGVGVEHPGQARAREPERRLDLRQGDVHDRRVEHDHELAGEDGGKDEAGPGRRGAVDGREGLDGHVGRLQG